MDFEIPKVCPRPAGDASSHASQSSHVLHVDASATLASASDQDCITPRAMTGAAKIAVTSAASLKAAYRKYGHAPAAPALGEMSADIQRMICAQLDRVEDIAALAAVNRALRTGIQNLPALRKVSLVQHALHAKFTKIDAAAGARKSKSKQKREVLEAFVKNGSEELGAGQRKLVIDAFKEHVKIDLRYVAEGIINGFEEAEDEAFEFMARLAPSLHAVSPAQRKVLADKIVRFTKASFTLTLSKLGADVRLFDSASQHEFVKRAAKIWTANPGLFVPLLRAHSAQSVEDQAAVWLGFSQLPDSSTRDNLTQELLTFVSELSPIARKFSFARLPELCEGRPFYAIHVRLDEMALHADLFTAEERHAFCRALATTVDAGGSPLSARATFAQALNRLTVAARRQWAAELAENEETGNRYEPFRLLAQSDGVLTPDEFASFLRSVNEPQGRRSTSAGVVLCPLHHLIPHFGAAAKATLVETVTAMPNDARHMRYRAMLIGHFDVFAPEHRQRILAMAEASPIRERVFGQFTSLPAELSQQTIDDVVPEMVQSFVLRSPQHIRPVRTFAKFLIACDPRIRLAMLQKIATHSNFRDLVPHVYPHSTPAEQSLMEKSLTADSLLDQPEHIAWANTAAKLLPLMAEKQIAAEAAAAAVFLE